jgi:hydrogenase maturation protease
MVHIVCFGNVWQGDDGFGIHVFRRLCEIRSLPPQVKVFEAGTMGLSALAYFDNCRKAVVVDALKTGGQIGSVQRLGLADFDLPDQAFSLHSMGVNHLLTVLPVVFEGGTLPEVVVIGAEIGAVQPFTDTLTPPLEAALEGAVRLVQRECMNSAS